MECVIATATSWANYINQEIYLYFPGKWQNVFIQIVLLDKSKETTKVSWLGNCYLSLHYGAVSSRLDPMRRVIGLKQYMPWFMIRFLLWWSLIPVNFMHIHQDYSNGYDCSSVNEVILINMGKLITRLTIQNDMTTAKWNTTQTLDICCGIHRVVQRVSLSPGGF